MIASLDGTVAAITSDDAVIEVGGVGNSLKWSSGTSSASRPTSQATGAVPSNPSPMSAT